jgi:predicted Rossmann-fold nucleotide-binding protein
MEWIQKELLGHGMISADNMDLFTLTDDPDMVVKTIKKTVIL